MVTIVHTVEAVALLITTDADPTVGIAALITVFRHRWLVSGALLLVSALALFGQFYRRLLPLQRFMCLLPQLSVLFVTSIGAVFCVFLSSCPDGYVHPALYVLCNQAWRIVVPFFYSAAIHARVRTISE